MSMQQRLVLLWASAALTALVLLGTGCGNSFPECDVDEECQAYNLDPTDDGFQAERTHCVDGICRQCSADSHCEYAHECRNNSCTAIANFCDAERTCPSGQYCRDNRCVNGCDAAYPCPDGYRCDNNQCVMAGDCIVDSDCPGDQICTDDNRCIDPPPCHDRRFQVVYFDFDDDRIRVDQEPNLNNNVECLNAYPSENVLIEGHCDERGTEEYNLALGNRRARSSQRYLERAGIDSGRIDTTSYGELRPAVRGSNESAWRQNRRTEFQWR